MDSIIRIIEGAISILIVYYIIRRWTGKSGKQFNLQFFKYLAFLAFFAFGGNIIARWIVSEPEIITQSVEQLKANPQIKREIGSFKGYGYNKPEIESITKLPARINIKIFGNQAETHLSVLVDSSKNIYEVKEFKIDSLIKE